MPQVTLNLPVAFFACIWSFVLIGAALARRPGTMPYAFTTIGLLASVTPTEIPPVQDAVTTIGLIE
jgi:hypothetical protein